MSQPSAVALKSLTKTYGKTRGIEDITFEIFPGEVLGFLDPNGAGKTTTIRTLMGLIHATSGSAKILGHDVLISSPQIRMRTGYLPGALNLYKNYTGIELLRFFAKIRHVNCDEEIFSLAKRLNLDLDKQITNLSQGNRQKVGVIQAVMHHPEVLFLDEPTAGLDPMAQREFELMLDENKKRGVAVMLSSHALSEVEHLADRVAIICDGKLLVVDQISALKAKALRSIDLFFERPISPELFSKIPGVTNVLVRGTCITCTVVGVETQVLKVAVTNGVSTVQTHEPSLESIFLNLIENSSAP